MWMMCFGVVCRGTEGCQPPWMPWAGGNKGLLQGAVGGELVVKVSVTSGFYVSMLTALLSGSHITVSLETLIRSLNTPL